MRRIRKSIYLMFLVVLAIPTSASGAVRYDKARMQAEQNAINHMMQINITFFGHTIQCESKNLPAELERICKDDPNLTFDSKNQNITVYGTTFHVNSSPNSRGFSLMTSVQPDSRKMLVVIRAIEKYHGKGTPDEDNYIWAPWTRPEEERTNTLIRLRRVHTEEGGTLTYSTPLKR